MFKKMTDFWNSLESVSKWSSYANASVALLGIFAAFIGAAVFLLGRREALLSSRETTEANRMRDQLISKNNLETADAKRETATTMLLVEELRKENGELVRRMAPRSLGEQGGLADRLSKYAGTNIRIVASPDFESQKFAGQLKLVLDWARWNVEFVRGEVIWNGVRVASSPVLSPNFLTRETDEEKSLFREKAALRLAAIEAMLGEFKRCGVESCQAPIVSTKETFEGIIMHIGPRPDAEERAYMKAQQELLTNQNLSWEERERLIEIIRKRSQVDDEKDSDDHSPVGKE